MRHLRDRKASRDRQGRLYGLTRSEAPGDFADELQDLVEELISEGHPRDELYEKLKHVALVLRRDDREDLEEEVLEVMDALSGWSAPSARI
ncbi:MAG: hypothetical protein WKF53_17030 [Rubrobacter sp.]|jgi:hypothetical protein